MERCRLSSYLGDLRPTNFLLNENGFRATCGEHLHRACRSMSNYVELSREEILCNIFISKRALMLTRISHNE
jgi:hypothetical protein